jgi:ATP-binding cassette subfamily B protein IrtB
MFKSMKRIIKWAGKYKGRLYLGSVFSFFSSLSTAIPTMAAAYALDKAIAAYWAGNTIESSLIWQMLWIIVGSIALNFLLSYLRAVLQESIGYEVVTDRGDYKV